MREDAGEPVCALSFSGSPWRSGLGVEGAAGDVEGEALAGEGGEGLLAILLLQASAADRFAPKFDRRPLTSGAAISDHPRQP